MNRHKSLDCLYSLQAYESSFSQNQSSFSSASFYRLRRSKSLDNIHLNVNISWFSNCNIIKKSRSMNYVNINNNQPTTTTTHQLLRMNNSNLIHTKLIDDHNLPTTISDDLFNVLMRFEKNRLRTFKNWPLSFVTPSELSKAGFYYLLHSDQVRCFECKITLFNWEQGDRAITEHFNNNTRCKLLNGYDVGNVAIDRTPLELLQEHVPLEALTPVESNHEEVIFEYNDLSSDDEELEQLNKNAIRFVNEQKTLNSPLELAQMRFNEDELFALMKSEEKRLRTFDTWPKELVDKVKPTDLAQCGFFYTLARDKVICAFCRIPAWDWADTDIPIKEHYKHNSDCPLLNDIECGNQPIQNIKFNVLLMEFQDIVPNYSSSYSEDEIAFPASWNSNNFSRQEPAVQVSNHFLINSHNNSSINQANTFDELPLDQFKLSQLNKIREYILPHKQADDRYLLCDSRINTFKNWPHKFPKKEQLAKAGFYYLGTDDQVKCYSCGLVLSKWSKNDDPWIEHCKYSGDCEYLRLEKGRDFTNRKAISKNSPESQAVCSSTGASSESSNSSDIENETYPESNSDEDLNLKNPCKICMIKETGVVFMPCGHLISCASCAVAMKDCPICRKNISDTMKIYLS